ncbi:MAG: methionyl-tRNA formyltransferase, partial [Burkholderiales bacterium]|nr:methionyl-tRNA formyltransferase [Burkholderiales bacterium]
TASSVAQAASRLSLPTEKPSSLREPEAQQALREANADVLVVAAYGLLLPPAVLAIPRRGCINIHASLLPRWRGAAPIQRAILAGDPRTGISIMQMDAGLDTGSVLLAESIAIAPGDTTGSLTRSLAELGARLIVEALASLDALKPRPQDVARATHAAKISRAEAAIDWNQPAAAIERQVRAFNPSPGAETRFGGETLKIWEATTTSISGAPGEVVACDASGIVVSCGSGALTLQRVQRSGGKSLPASDFARGVRLLPGVVFAARPPGIRTMPPTH